MSHSLNKPESPAPDNPEDNVWFCDLVLRVSNNEVLRQLENLKAIGRAHEDIEKDFQLQQARAATDDTAKDAIFWLRKMCDSMRQMDESLHFVPTMRDDPERLRFLDIGCAPGGYSQYVLLQNWQAQGVGITLPANEGGHLFYVPKNLTQKGRYQVHFEDVTTYDIVASFAERRPRSSLSQTPRPKLLPFSHSSFKLVILDGHVLRTRPRVLGINRILALKQLIIGLQAVKDGGTVFMKLSRITNSFTARIIYLLDAVTRERGRLDLVKPTVVHSNRGTFYAVARGIQKGELLNQYVQSLYQVLGVEEKYYAANQDVTEQLGGPGAQELKDTPGLLQVAGESELDAIVPMATLEETYIPRLAELLEPVWEVHRNGMRNMLRKKGVDV